MDKNYQSRSKGFTTAFQESDRNLLPLDDEHYFVSDYGFKVMDLVNYLNHSDNPNVISINDGEFFEAIKDILTGEELFIDYETIVSE